MDDLDERRARYAAQMRQTLECTDTAMERLVAEGTAHPEGPTTRYYRRSTTLAGLTASFAQTFHFHVATNRGEGMAEATAVALAHLTVNREIEAAYQEDLAADRAQRETPTNRAAAVLDDRAQG